MMRLIDNDDIPSRSSQKSLHAHGPLQAVDRSDHSVVDFPRRRSVIHEIDTQDLEVQPEGISKLSVPVFRQSCWSNDQDSFRLTSGDQLSNDHPGLDRFAQSDLVCDEESSPSSIDDVAS